MSNKVYFITFETPENNPPLRVAIDFYKHDQNWSNRLIAGDSLLVMNSLLEKEGMEGKVQMIYTLILLMESSMVQTFSHL